jgi:iron complex transport system permease protein
MKLIPFRNIIIIAVLLAIVAAAALLSLCLGSSGLKLSLADAIDKSIVLDIRLPRILLGFAVGGALSVAGVILQGLFRNPLVEPYTTGISGGAVLGVAICITFGLPLLQLPGGFLILPLTGFAGSFLVILLLYITAVRSSSLNIQNVLLTGVMFSFISSSLMLLIMALSKAESLERIILWMMGSLDQNNWGLIETALILSGLSLAASCFFAIDLNALSLGEEQAAHLGIDIERSKRFLFIIASLITGFCVSVAGVIGFVGLLIPHFMRIIAGRDHRILLISSFLGGSAFLILSDTIARTIIAPQELPVGVITGLTGGILFIYSLSARKASV